MFFVCVSFLELATTLKYLGAKWPPEKKVNFMPLLIITFVPGLFTSILIIITEPKIQN